MQEKKGNWEKGSTMREQEWTFFFKNHHKGNLWYVSGLDLSQLSLKISIYSTITWYRHKHSKICYRRYQQKQEWSSWEIHILWHPNVLEYWFEILEDNNWCEKTGLVLLNCAEWSLSSFLVDLAVNSQVLPSRKHSLYPNQATTSSHLLSPNELLFSDTSPNFSSDWSESS